VSLVALFGSSGAVKALAPTPSGQSAALCAPSALAAGGDETWFQSDTYAYDAVGNPTDVLDTKTGLRECYRYDSWQRLTRAWTKASSGVCETAPTAPVASGTNGFDETYSIDLIGRMTSWTAGPAGGTLTTRTFSYNTSQPDAPTSDGVTTLVYDANGSAVSRAGTTLSWDALHRMIGFGTGQTNIYGNDNTRLVRIDSTTGQTTVFLPGQQITGPSAGGTPTSAIRTYSIGGTVVATRTATGAAGIFWNCAQRQASVACTTPVNTTGVGVIPAKSRYLPYGAPRTGSVTPNGTERGFVGQITDNNGIDILGVRAYDPTFAHFLSADPLATTTGDPYLYAAANPTTLTDPNGLVGLSTACSGIDGIGCVNNTTSAGFTSYQRTPNGDVITAVFHAQGFQPLDVTDELAKHGNATEKRINRELHDCASGDSDGECARLAILIAGGSIADSESGWRSVCAANAGKCGNVGDAIEMSAFSEVMFNASLFLSFYSGGTSLMAFVSDEGAIASTAVLEEGIATEAESGVLDGAVCSFDPDTQVLMADGTTKAIKDVAIGDSVEAADPSSGQDRGGRSVTALHRHQDDDLIDIDVTGRDGKLHVIHTTARHPFWEDSSHTWVRAGNLRAGQELRTFDGRDVVIADVSDRSGESEMLNLTVSGLHTFYVKAGDVAVLVHNTCRDGFGRGGQRLSPDPAAGGSPHSTFRTDPVTGEVTHYTTWEPNPQNPLGYDPVLRYDGVGGAHFNKIDQIDVPTPHVQGPGIPGGVRPAQPWEIPWR
jgi:RHS repeat-associated protein